MFTRYEDTGTFHFKEMKPRYFTHSWSNCMSFYDEYVLVIGGRIGGRFGEAQTDVERYKVETNDWDLLPSLNIGRAGLGCCHAGLSIYVIGGMTDGRKRVTSIETLSFSEMKNSDTFKWQLIEIPDGLYVPRSDPGVINFRGTDILIFGGLDQNEKELSDFHIFNTRFNRLSSVRSSFETRFTVATN